MSYSLCLGNESDFGQTELPSMTNGNGVDHPEILDNDSVAQVCDKAYVSNAHNRLQT